MDVQKLIQRNLQMTNEVTSRAVDTSGILGKVEAFFVSLGLNNPLMRAAFIGSLTAGALFVLQPNFAFSEGKPRAWEPFAAEDQLASSTMTPWWVVAFFSGVAAGLFF